MIDKFLYNCDEDLKKRLIENFLEIDGRCINKEGGLCGEIYIFDKGINCSPRYICAKIPKLSDLGKDESNKRFINELEKQLSYFGHAFVHWPFEFKILYEKPVALFCYWGSDLKKLIKENNVSIVQKLSIMIYTAVGLKYCQNKGLISHQDLKPANIFLKDLKQTQVGLSNYDIHTQALIADFGLANAFKDSSTFDGSRPYMAPEQWDKTELTLTTDVFALGVILFELMSGGFHPAIEDGKLSDFWPIPTNGNTKKWTRSKPWEKWSKEPIILYSNHKISKNLIVLIQEMINKDPMLRPSLDSVINRLLLELSQESNEAYEQIKYLISSYNMKSKNKNFRETWSPLAKEWDIFKRKFN